MSATAFLALLLAAAPSGSAAGPGGPSIRHALENAGQEFSARRAFRKSVGERIPQLWFLSMRPERLEAALAAPRAELPSRERLDAQALRFGFALIADRQELEENRGEVVRLFKEEGYERLLFGAKLAGTRTLSERLLEVRARLDLFDPGSVLAWNHLDDIVRELEFERPRAKVIDADAARRRLRP